MAIVFQRSWESGTTENASGGQLTTSIVHTGTYAYLIPAGQTATILLPAAETSAWVAAWVYIRSFATARLLLGLYNGINLAGGLYFNTDRRLYLVQQDGSVAVAPYSLQLAVDTWYHVMLRLTVGAAATIEAKLGGTVILTNASADTRPSGSGTDVDRILSVGSTGDTIIDDLVVSDSAYPGDARTYTVKPNGAGNAQQFTPSSAVAHDTLVDDVPPNTAGSDDYVYSSTVGHREQFALEAMPAISGNYTILAAQVKVIASESAATGLSIDTGVRAGTTNYDDGLTHALQTSQTLHEGTIREVNPDTTVAWVDADINALQAGVKVL